MAALVCGREFEVLYGGDVVPVSVRVIRCSNGPGRGRNGWRYKKGEVGGSWLCFFLFFDGIFLVEILGGIYGWGYCFFVFWQGGMVVYGC